MSTNLLQQGRDVEWHADTVAKAALTQGPALATEVDVASSTVTYVGKAAIGTAGAAALWQIQEITTTAGGSASIKWADGNALYDNIWDNRASLSYS